VSDIYEDAQWLNGTVENLLTVTRLENGGVHLSPTCELVGDVIDEALRHVNPDVARHEVRVVPPTSPSSREWTPTSSSR